MGEKEKKSVMGENENNFWSCWQQWVEKQSPWLAAVPHTHWSIIKKSYHSCVFVYLCISAFVYLCICVFVFATNTLILTKDSNYWKKNEDFLCVIIYHWFGQKLTIAEETSVVLKRILQIEMGGCWRCPREGYAGKRIYSDCNRCSLLSNQHKWT